MKDAAFCFLAVIMSSEWSVSFMIVLIGTNHLVLLLGVSIKRIVEYLG